MKYLSEKYKTYEGARKRAAFENGIAKSEFDRGYKAKHYQYTIAEIDGVWRVARDQKTVAERKWQQGKLAPVAQKQCDHGLFSDDAKQTELFK